MQFLSLDVLLFYVYKIDGIQECNILNINSFRILFILIFTVPFQWVSGKSTINISCYVLKNDISCR